MPVVSIQKITKVLAANNYFTSLYKPSKNINRKGYYQLKTLKIKSYFDFLVDVSSGYNVHTMAEILNANNIVAFVSSNPNTGTEWLTVKKF